MSEPIGVVAAAGPVDLAEVEADIADVPVELLVPRSIGDGPMSRLIRVAPALVAEVKRLREMVADQAVELERLCDLVAEFRKRDETQDRIRVQLTRDRDVWRAAVERVRALHKSIPDGKPDAGFCDGCETCWPCATVRALDGAE